MRYKLDDPAPMVITNSEVILGNDILLLLSGSSKILVTALIKGVKV